MEVPQEMVQVVRIRHNQRLVRVLTIDRHFLKWLEVPGTHIIQRGDSLVLVRVVVATLHVLLALGHFLVGVLLLRIVTKYRLVYHRVEYLLLPPVILLTIGLEFASLLILANEVASLP